MHYFKMNIGDYAKKAGRLSILEHGAYTLLMHACYDRERFPTLEDALDWCWARSDDEIKAVKFVLSKFFTLKDGIYIQSRIQEEIDKYHKNAIINKRIAIEREEKRKNKKQRTVRGSCTSVNEPPPNQEPRTINQEPLKEKIIKKEIDPELKKLLPDVDDQVIKDFSTLRKQKKAPITESAIAGLRQQAALAGINLQAALIVCCQNGWQGFTADWYQKAQPPPSNYQTKQQIASIAARTFFNNESNEKCINDDEIGYESTAKQLGR